MPKTRKQKRPKTDAQKLKRLIREQKRDAYNTLGFVEANKRYRK